MTNIEIAEIDAFIEQMFDKWQKVGTGFKGSYLEQPLSENLKSFYPQFRFIALEYGKNIFLDKIEKDKLSIANRSGEIIRKLLLTKEWKEKKVNKISFLLGDSEKELATEEFLDIILYSVSAIIEHYISLIKEQKCLDLPELSQKLGYDKKFISNISKLENIKDLFETLAKRTNEKYSLSTVPIFSKEEYQIRCACFHGDFNYLIENDEAFLVFGGDVPLKMSLTQFINFSINLIAKLNILIILPFYFITALPLKGFKKLA